MKKMFIVMILALCAPWSRVIADGITPIQISIWSPIQVFPRDWDVVGLRYGGFYSRNSHVYGLDIGFFNRADSSSGGIQLGLMNTVSDLGFGFFTVNLGRLSEIGKNIYRSDSGANYTGIQLGFFYNHADDMRGLQLSPLVGVNQAVTLTGFQFAMINQCYSGSGLQLAWWFSVASHDFSGAQLGMLNICDNGVGLQLALFGNIADRDFSGAQITSGFFNFCTGSMTGAQIGLINYAGKMTGVQIGALNIIKESPVPFLPVINAHF